MTRRAGAFAGPSSSRRPHGAAVRHATAVRDGDDWVLTGGKTFITGGGRADVIIVVARTGAPRRNSARTRSRRSTRPQPVTEPGDRGELLGQAEPYHNGVILKG